jgi:phage baseplate assembly protein W
MGAFNTTLGYTTINNEWEILTDKELAKHDLLMVLYTRRGECDWDPNFGTSIMDKIFSPKTSALKADIIDEITKVFDDDPRLELNSINTSDLPNGWVFYCEISYLEGVPENWNFSITEEGIRVESQGYYPLGA